MAITQAQGSSLGIPASAGQASGLATLNGSSLVVQNPASLGSAGGVCGLDSNSYVPVANINPVGIVLTQYMETVNAMGNATGANTINLTAGGVVTATSTGNTTWTFSNPAASGKCSSFTLILTNGGANTQTWPSGTKWPGGSAPTLTSSGTDVLVFFSVNGGTNWYGSLAQKGCA